MIAVGRAMAVATALGLAGCASTFPDGVVKDSDQAIAIAKAQCAAAAKDAHVNWRAFLTDHTWGVRGSNYAFTLWVEIDAVDGKVAHPCGHVVVS